MSALKLDEMIAELVQSQKETNRMMQETDRKMKDTDNKIKEVFAGLANQSRDTDRKMAETDRRINKLFGKSGYDIGRMVEAIVEPACMKLFRARGIDVRFTMRRLESDIPGREMELDILMLNGAELVAVEVKSMMNGGDVTQWIKKLGRLRLSFTQYGTHKIYGAVAALEYGGNADRFAHKKGLFVLRWSDDLMTLANSSDFQGKCF
jgi:hypothetical protein